MLKNKKIYPASLAPNSIEDASLLGKHFRTLILNILNSNPSWDIIKWPNTSLIKMIFCTVPMFPILNARQLRQSSYASSGPC